MLRRSLVVLTVAAVLGSVSADLNACGDKFLRAGRSAKNRGYASVFPASILVYKPNATANGIKEFDSLLRKAGHKPVFLKDGAILSQTLTSAKYDLVIADYSDTTAIKNLFSAASAEPGLLPILHKPTKAQEAEAKKLYPCLLNIEKMTKYDALEEIDHLMQQRRKGMPATAAAK